MSDSAVAQGVFIVLALACGLIALRCLGAANRAGASTDPSGRTAETPWGLVVAALLFASFAALSVAGSIYVPKWWKHDDTQNAFISAAAAGDLTTVRRMLDQDPTLIDARQNRPRFALVSNSKYASLERPLTAAARQGQAAMVELLLSRGADVNAVTSDGQTALYAAGENVLADDATTVARRTAVMRLLLSRHADVNIVSRRSRMTALHAHAKQPDAVALLIEAGANVRAVDQQGETALHRAANSGRDESAALKLLLEHGAGANERDRSGNTAMILAASNAAMIDALIAHGATVNVRNNDGDTPLHEAARSPQSLRSGVRALAALCACGANTAVRNKANQTPLDVAEKELAAETDRTWIKTRQAVVKFLSAGGLCDQLVNRRGHVTEAERTFLAAQAGCDAGDPHSCRTLAWAYDAGEGVAQDTARAAALYETACTSGSSWACGNLGVLYSTGSGVRKDKVRAAALFQTACDDGSAVQCANLARLYDRGEGMPKDRTRALALYRKACDGGERDACDQLKHTD